MIFCTVTRAAVVRCTLYVRVLELLDVAKGRQWWLDVACGLCDDWRVFAGRLDQGCG